MVLSEVSAGESGGGVVVCVSCVVSGAAAVSIKSKGARPLISHSSAAGRSVARNGRI